MSKHFVQGLPGKVLSFLVVVLLSTLAIVGIRNAAATVAPTDTQIVGWVESIVMKGQN